MHKTYVVGLALSFGMVALAGCSTATVGPESGVPVFATLRDANGKSVGGATFIQTATGVQLELSVNGLSPGKHGVHFHESGKCEGPDFKSAGPHFQGAQQKHGEHWGDLPNLVADKNGVGAVSVITSSVTLTPGDRSLLRQGGTSLVLHAKEDDGTTDPSGNSGDRIACGVITK